MAKVSIEETMLKNYSDKELVRYICNKIEAALYDTPSENIPFEVASMACITEIRNVMPLLRAVDRRMNGDGRGHNIVV